MKKILLINQGHTPNIGDQAIAMSMAAWGKKNGYDCDVMPFWDEKSVFQNVFLGKYAKYIKKIPGLLDLFTKRWIRELLNKKTYDAAVIGGGELFCNHRGFNSAFGSWVSFLHKRQTDIYVYGVSGDENMPKILLLRNKRALKACKYVGVRDCYSKDVFERNYQVNVQLFPDIVFSNRDLCLDPSADKRGIVCIPIPNIVFPSANLEVVNQSEYESYLVRLIEEKRVEDEKVFFSTTEQRDEKQVEQICRNINEKYNKDYVYVQYQDVQSFCKLVSDTRLVISARMHAMILGLLNKCEIEPIPFKKKLEMFQKEYGNIIDIEKIIEKSEKGLEELATFIEKE